MQQTSSAIGIKMSVSRRTCLPSQVQVAQVISLSEHLRVFALGSLLLVVSVGHTIFTELSLNADGSLPYSASGAALFCELFKAIFAAPLLVRLRIIGPKAVNLEATTGVVYRMAMPAFLYSLGNVVSYHAISHLGSTKISCTQI